MSAKTARYPVSLSPSLPGADGEIRFLGQGLTAVGRFEEETTKFGVFWGMTGFALDLSDEINSAVRKHGGDGVVSLSVTAEDCFLNWLFPLTLIPLWPGCTHVKVSGIVVKASPPMVSNASPGPSSAAATEKVR